MAFATEEDIATRLGRALSDIEAATVSDLLDQATGLIQGEAKQTITLVTDDEITLRGSRDREIILPERPVVSVSSVTLNGQALTTDSDWYVDGDKLIRRRMILDVAHGLYSEQIGWGFPAWALVVTYTHGYETIPDAIRAVTISLVVRSFVNPGGVMMERLGQAQMQYAYQGSAPGMLLTADERRTIRRALGRTAESLPIH